MKSQSSQTLSKIADTVPITRTTSENQEAFSKSMTTSVSSAISVSNQNQPNRKMRERSASGTFLSLPNPSPRNAIMSELQLVAQPHHSLRQRKVPIPIICARSHSVLVRIFKKSVLGINLLTNLFTKYRVL